MGWEDTQRAPYGKGSQALPGGPSSNRWHYQGPTWCLQQSLTLVLKLHGHEQPICFPPAHYTSASSASFLSLLSNTGPSSNFGREWPGTAPEGTVPLHASLWLWLPHQPCSSLLVMLTDWLIAVSLIRKKASRHTHAFTHDRHFS